MPTYDYACDDCGHAFEQFQSITAKMLRKCPECGKPKLKRLIGTGAGVIFKGSGFYETDYRSESYRKAAKAEKDAASGGKSGPKDTDKGKEKGTGKTEASTATTSESTKSAPQSGKDTGT